MIRIFYLFLKICQKIVTYYDKLTKLQEIYKQDFSAEIEHISGGNQVEALQVIIASLLEDVDDQLDLGDLDSWDQLNSEYVNEKISNLNKIAQEINQSFQEALRIKDEYGIMTDLFLE